MSAVLIFSVFLLAIALSLPIGISMILGAGVIIVILSILAAIYALISYCTGHVVPGWTSLILSIWFLGGIQLMAVGLVGQYIGKIYIEVKHRPRYNIEKVLK